MKRFVFRLLASSLGLWLATSVVDGITVDGPGPLVAAALLLGIVNAVVRPIAVILTFPLTILSLGLFLLVINGTMLLLVGRLVAGFHVEGLTSAVLGSIVVGVVGWFAQRPNRRPVSERRS